MATKKKQISKSSTLVKSDTNVNPPIKSFEEEFYFDMFSFRMEPINPAYIEKFALEWVETVIRDESIITLEQFFVMKRITRDTIRKWLTRSETLREAKNYVLMILAGRRERGVITKQYEPSMVKWMQPLYDPAAKDIEEWRATLKEKVTGALVGVRIVEVPKFEDVPAVKPSKSTSDE